MSMGFKDLFKNLFIKEEPKFIKQEPTQELTDEADFLSEEKEDGKYGI